MTINNIVTTYFFAFLRFRCHKGIFLAIIPRMATKSAKNLKMRCDNEPLREPRVTGHYPNHDPLSHDPRNDAILIILC